MQTISKTKAAVQIFKTTKRAMSPRELIDIALKKKLIKVKGLTPSATMNADIINENKRRSSNGLKPRFKKNTANKWMYVGD